MLDKVRYVTIGGIISIPFLFYYVWYSIQARLQDIVTLWLILAISFAILLGLFVGIFFNPALTYKRNDNICVSGLPFPVHYGMPVEDSCISGHFEFRNFILDIIYFCLLSLAYVLLIISLILKSRGFIYAYIVGIPVSSYYILDLVLKFYPINSTETRENNI